jgi:hypothetical protein
MSENRQKAAEHLKVERKPGQQLIRKESDGGHRMKQDDYSFFRVNVPLTVICTIIPVVLGYYAAALFVTTEKNTIYTIIEQFNIVYNNPLPPHWYFNVYTIPLIVFNLLVYACAVVVIGAMYRPHRYGEEQGSARFESAARVTKQLADLNNDVEDVKNIVVIRKKKENFFVEKIRNIVYRIKYRNAE